MYGITYMDGSGSWDIYNYSSPIRLVWARSRTHRVSARPDHQRWARGLLLHVQRPRAACRAEHVLGQKGSCTEYMGMPLGH